MCRHIIHCPDASAACHGASYCTIDHDVYVGPIPGPFLFQRGGCEDGNDEFLNREFGQSFGCCTG